MVAEATDWSGSGHVEGEERLGKLYRETGRKGDQGRQRWLDVVEEDANEGERNTRSHKNYSLFVDIFLFIFSSCRPEIRVSLAVDFPDCAMVTGSWVSLTPSPSRSLTDFGNNFTVTQVSTTYSEHPLSLISYFQSTFNHLLLRHRRCQLRCPFCSSSFSPLCTSSLCFPFPQTSEWLDSPSPGVIKRINYNIKS